MRRVVENDVTPKEAVKVYHNQLKNNNLLPDQNIKNDLQITDPILKL